MARRSSSRATTLEAHVIKVHAGDFGAGVPVASNRLIINNIRIILCAFCAEDYLQQIEYQPVTCHPCLSPHWKTCRKVPVWTLAQRNGPKTCRKVPCLDPGAKKWVGGVIGKCLIHSLLRIILCAKRAEDYLQQVEYQSVTCHPCLSPHWKTCWKVPVWTLAQRNGPKTCL